MAKSPKTSTRKRVTNAARSAKKSTVTLLQDPVATAHQYVSKRYAGTRGVQQLRKDTRVASIALLTLEATDFTDLI
tara:strand:- start:1471 stop:1698 length:228 start_codon:yes stop_codon:yes gene_type:complete